MSITSFSRLGTANAFDASLANLEVRQTALTNLQQQMTSGKKITSPSDDPTGAAQAERAMNRIARIATDQRALEAQKNSISAAEGTLGTITDALQNFRDLVVSAGNGSTTPSDRVTIATQLKGLRDQVLNLANTLDSNGQPLFAALGSALKPFVGPQTTAPDYTFKGLPGPASSSEVTIPSTLDGDAAFMFQPSRDGAFNLSVGNSTTADGAIPALRTLQAQKLTITDSTQIADNADAAAATAPLPGPAYSTIQLAFTSVTTDPVTGITTAAYSVNETPAVPHPASGGSVNFKAGNPFTVSLPGMQFEVAGTPAVGDTITLAPSGSIFSALDTAIRDIGGAANKNAASQAVTQALQNVDIGLSKVASVRGQAGDLLNRADRITSNNDQRNIVQEANRSRAEDMDMIKGVSDFQNQQTGYQAALQSYAQVKKLSLFNFIS